MSIDVTTPDTHLDPCSDFAANRWRLALAQLLSGVGIASGVAVGAVLVEEVSGRTDVAGFASTATVLGAGLLAYPLSRLADRAGRGQALALGFGLGAAGAVGILIGAQTRQFWLLLLALGLFGSATAAGLQSRYAATDLAPPHLRARAMSVVVWATTVGSVAGPHLSAPGDRLGRRLGLTELVGPYLFSVIAFALASLVSLTLRNPPGSKGRGDAGGSARTSLAQCLRLAWAEPGTRLGLVAVVTGQMMMASVMVMTPLHMHHASMGLDRIGVVISSHILGMYALSPVVGWLTDRLGSRTVIAVGMGIFALAFVGGILDASGQSRLARLIPALVLLGLGWSCTLIAGSALVAQSVSTQVRVPMQGTVDTVMSCGAAALTAFAGLVLAKAGFIGINLMATLVLLGLALVWATTDRRAGQPR